MLRSIAYVSMILGTWVAVIAWILYLRSQNKETIVKPKCYPLSPSIVNPKQRDAVFNEVDKLTSWIAFYKQTQEPKEGPMFINTAVFQPTVFIYKEKKFGFVTLDDLILYREWYFKSIMKISTTSTSINCSPIQC